MQDRELSDAELEGVSAGLGKTPAVTKDPPRSERRTGGVTRVSSAPAPRMSAPVGGGCAGGSCSM